jgi:predicted GTPase
MEKPSWTAQVAGAWQGAWQGLTAKVLEVLPIDRAAQTAMSWFSVDEAQVAEILSAVRSQLPTTEVLLLGKPQAGKSSIVRGLTGVAPDIIGQGFRPHTQHTERYAYPSADLPLLIFTDTVGFGDSAVNPELTLQELLTDLQQDTQGARILILVVKVKIS